MEDELATKLSAPLSTADETGLQANGPTVATLTNLALYRVWTLTTF